MIIKLAETGVTPGAVSSDARVRAGAEAERQMAFYLHRWFANDGRVWVLNDLRIVDPGQPEYDGSPGVCQIDHLVLHQAGAFIIESKSVHDEVSVRDDGSGGDEWTRRFRGRQQGFPSPVQQARRQGEFLRGYLQARRAQMLSKLKGPLGVFTKVAFGTDQRGFTHMPLQIIIAISDNGKIRRINRWQEPQEPFQTYVSKADLIKEKIESELDRHTRSNGLLSPSDGGYGIWSIPRDDLRRVAEYLKASHTPAPRASMSTSRLPEELIPDAPVRVEFQDRPEQAQPPSVVVPMAPHDAQAQTGGAAAQTADKPSCKRCQGISLTALWGRYGPYWKCQACGVNTPMPTICSACGTEGHRGETVRIRKEGPKYYRSCSSCGIEERIWTAG